MRNRLTVQVCGGSNSGKSTVQQIITEALQNHGFAVMWAQYDIGQCSVPEEVQEKRIKALKDKNTSILIAEKQVKVEPNE